MSDDLIVYDKAKWHYDGEDYPDDLSEDNAYTHGGFYLAWLVDNDLTSAEFQEDEKTTIADYRRSYIKPSAFFEIVDGVLASDMLSEKGNAFTEYYYADLFFDDYELLFEDADSPYHVRDTKKNYKLVSRMIDEAYEEWEEQEKQSAG